MKKIVLSVLVAGFIGCVECDECSFAEERLNAIINIEKKSSYCEGFCDAACIRYQDTTLCEAPCREDCFARQDETDAGTIEEYDAN